MTLENLKKQHAHLKWLASGEFNERDFDYKIEANDNPNGKKGEGGWSTMGDMKPARRQLIQQDAVRTLEIFERKYPEFKKAEKPAKPKPKNSEESEEPKPEEKK